MDDLGPLPLLKYATLEGQATAKIETLLRVEVQDTQDTYADGGKSRQLLDWLHSNGIYPSYSKSGGGQLIVHIEPKHEAVVRQWLSYSQVTVP